MQVSVKAPSGLNVVGMPDSGTAPESAKSKFLRNSGCNPTGVTGVGPVISGSSSGDGLQREGLAADPIWTVSTAEDLSACAEEADGSGQEMSCFSFFSS
jgi:hypothetical protein